MWNLVFSEINPAVILQQTNTTMTTPSSSGVPNFASPSLFSPVTPFTGADAFPEQKEDTSKWKERNDRQLRLWGIKGQV